MISTAHSLVTPRSFMRRRTRLMAQTRLYRQHDERVEYHDLEMMERAIVLARQAAASGEVPVGAVVYRGNELLAEAANNRERSADPTGHAEVVAIRQAGERIGAWRLEECSIAVTLEPCPMCAGAIVNARMGRVLYGATDPKAGACDTLFTLTRDERLNHRLETIGGIFSERCAALLSNFFRQRRAEKKALRLQKKKHQTESAR